MFFKILLLFVTVPLIELMLLIKVGEIIGILNTVLLIIFTGITGGSIARSQGYQVVRKIRSDLNSGNLPADEMVGALLILAGGIMLLTPGILTDVFGFALILPPSRKIIAKYVKERFVKYLKSDKVNVYYNGSRYNNSAEDTDRSNFSGDDFIDVNYEDVEEEEDDNKK
ncbi:MAG: FxsA family protein [Bacillota bacterium]